MALTTLKAHSGGGDSFEVPPAGNHPGVLVAIVDLGTQASEFQGKERKAHEVFLCWELTNQIVAGTRDRHHLIGKRFTFGFHTKSALRQLIEKWRGLTYKDDEVFDPQKILGRTCLVNVSNSTSEDRTFAKFEGVSPLPKELPCPAAQNRPLLWEVESGALQALEWLPWSYGQKIADIVASSPEWKARTSGRPAPNPSGNGAAGAAGPAGGQDQGVPDEIPF
jgi:hypothetical protein